MVGADNPVAQGCTMLITSTLENYQTGVVGGGDVGIELVQRGVALAEKGEGVDHCQAVAFVAMFVRDDDSHGGTPVDWVVVVELNATDGLFVLCETVEFQFAGAEGVAFECF